MDVLDAHFAHDSSESEGGAGENEGDDGGGSDPSPKAASLFTC